MLRTAGGSMPSRVPETISSRRVTFRQTPAPSRPGGLLDSVSCQTAVGWTAACGSGVAGEPTTKLPPQVSGLRPSRRQAGYPPQGEDAAARSMLVTPSARRSRSISPPIV